MLFSDKNRRKLLNYLWLLPQNIRGHSVRVGLYMQILVADLVANSEYFLSYSEKGKRVDSDWIRDIGYYHDVGKALLPQEIISSKKALTAAEEKILRRHTTAGSKLLSAMADRADSTNKEEKAFLLGASSGHHENWDGSGYPKGLIKENIPLFGRICAVANSYENMTRQKPPLSHKKAAEYIKNQDGIIFDPVVVQAFIRCEKSFRKLNKSHTI